MKALGWLDFFAVSVLRFAALVLVSLFGGKSYFYLWAAAGAWTMADEIMHRAMAEREKKDTQS